MDWAAQQRSVGSVSPVLIHRGDSLHLRICQLKVENIKVFGNVRLIAGTGNGNIARLEMPAQQNLCRGLAVCCRDRGNCGVVEQLLRVAPPAQGEPGFQNGPVLFQMFLHSGTLVMGVRLILEQRRGDRGGIHQLGCQ